MDIIHPIIPVVKDYCTMGNERKGLGGVIERDGISDCNVILYATSTQSAQPLQATEDSVDHYPHVTPRSPSPSCRMRLADRAILLSNY